MKPGQTRSFEKLRGRHPIAGPAYPVASALDRHSSVRKFYGGEIWRNIRCTRPRLTFKETTSGLDIIVLAQGNKQWIHAHTNKPDEVRVALQEHWKRHGPGQ